MKITYISHATLLIETNGIKILTDPWFFGSTYCNQWHLYPKATENYEELIKEVDFVLISHGHEDHIHHESLKKINKKATIFYPYTWFSGAKEYFNSLGFKIVIEAKNEKKYNLSSLVHVTFLANNLDNVIVIEDDKKVLVNINDALPSAPEGVIKFFIKKIKNKWKKINYLFSSYGGASYFPNTIKCEWKNDLEIGLVREQYFLDNFCLMSQDIGADYSFPFASDFVLLDKNQRWMNEVKFPRSKIESYYNTYFNSKATHMIAIYPSDIVTEKEIQYNSKHHTKTEIGINELIENEFKNEILQKRNEKQLTAGEFEILLDKLKKQILKKQHIIPENQKGNLTFLIRLTDYSQKIIEVTVKKEKTEIIACIPNEKKYPLIFNIKSNTLLYSISNEWGGDAIIIGYGCEIEIFKKEIITQQIDNLVVQLLTNYPNTKEYIKKNPIRALNYMRTDSLKRKLVFNKILNKKEDHLTTNKILKNHEMWLTRSKCEICRICDLPLITNENAKYLI